MGGTASQPNDLAHEGSSESDGSDNHPDTPPALAADASSLASICPTEFKWSFGGHSVYVTGAWDDWRVKAALSRSSPHHFVTVLALPVGTYQYKFIVDGNWKHSPAYPTERDQHGNLNNIIIVTPQMPEYDSNDPLVPEALASSPIETYDFSMIPQEDHSSEPPMLPRLLASAPMDYPGLAANGTTFVRLNHIFGTKTDQRYGSRNRDLRTMASEVRYRSTVITTILVTPRSKSMIPMDFQQGEFADDRTHSVPMDEPSIPSLGESQSLLLDALNNV